MEKKIILTAIVAVPLAIAAYSQQVALRENTPTPLIVLRVLSPNGGERVDTGSSLPIKWIDDRDISKTSIQLVDALDATKKIEIASDVEGRSSGIDGTNVYLWNTVGAPPGSYKVRICDVETRQCDDSDTPFVLAQ